MVNTISLDLAAHRKHYITPRYLYILVLFHHLIRMHDLGCKVSR